MKKSKPKKKVSWTAKAKATSKAKPQEPAAPPVVDPPRPATIIAFKGFDKNLQCRGFQFEVGKTYEHAGEVKACESGFHACRNPLDVLAYYPPADSRFAEVELSGAIDEHGDDSKVAASVIAIKSEISLDDLIRRAVAHRIAQTDSGAASNSGYSGAASNSGDRGAASNSGDRGAASNSGYSGAASNSGKHGVAADFSGSGRAKSSTGGAIILVQRKPWPDLSIVRVVSAVVGENGVKPDTWYKVSEQGELVEA